GLACNTLYHFKVTSTNSGGTLPASWPDATLTTGACGSTGGPVSDDFHSLSLNAALWTAGNPLNHANISLNGTKLILCLPAGTAHDAWTSNLSVRVMQAISNVDFEVVAKFDSIPGQFSQMQGILAEQDSNNYLRFDVYHDGTTVRLFSATIVGGTATIQSS